MGMGLLHRGTEVFSYNNEFNKNIPYNARTDYVSYISGLNIITCASHMIFNEYYKTGIMILYNEHGRLLNHLLFIGCNLLDIGLTSIFIIAFATRDRLLTIFEYTFGARLHIISYNIPNLYINICKPIIAIISIIITNLYVFNILYNRMCIGNINSYLNSIYARYNIDARSLYYPPSYINIINLSNINININNRLYNRISMLIQSILIIINIYYII